ncbi:TPA_asm: hypothetical protein [Myosoton aquaticum amalgavirus 3]|nr:TPA_asm: hypothetical protein [Myosoton aquaticum amalgavirus 3]
MQGGSASSSVARPGQTVDYAAELVVMLAPIAEQGFKVEEWTPPAIVRSFLTVKRFLDTVKAFCGLQDVNVRRAVVNQAIIKKVLFSPETTSLGDFYKFCLWLKTSDGSQVLNASIKEVNLRKKILPGQTQENVAYAAMLSEQISEFHQLIKERRVFHEKKLQELRRAVVLYQEEADADIRDIYAEYSPCPDYVELDDMELNRRCWEAFLAACRAKGTEPAEMDEVVMEEARREYERDVRSLHKTEFLAVESRREDLKSWCEEKILELSSVGDRRKANLFRSFVDLSGGAMDDAVREEAEKRRDEARGDRPGRKRTASEVDPANVIASGIRRYRRRPNPRLQTQGPNIERDGDGGQPSSDLGQQHADTDITIIGGAQAAGDPPRS